MKKLRLSAIMLLAALCMDFAGAQEWTGGLSFPSFTDTADPNGWRSWICLANPYNGPADYDLGIYDQSGNYIGGKYGRLAAASSIFIRPRNLVGYDCLGSAVVVYDIPLTGILEKTRNNNQMTNSYSAVRLEYQIRTSSEYAASNMTIANGINPS
ncbi:hypothetical protein [Methanothrix sp.]|uniref:hypothetical protein n=1 Tax=Methanothrix sp. TaxID=90426 RepID=UPI003BB54CA7